MSEQLEIFEQRCRDFFRSLWPGEEKPLVFGCGNREKPVLMLIGEAPGEQEVLEGKPFVGKAGKNLTAFLEGADLHRDEIYITNTVKIRPARLSPAGRMVNRPPTREEIGLFRPYLFEEMAIVSPQLVVTLGNVPLKALAGDKTVIGQCHGRLLACDIETPGKERISIELFPLYHPASVIYNPSLKAIYEADMAALRMLVHQRQTV